MLRKSISSLLDLITSLALCILAPLSIVTGLFSDAYDLNDFVWHIKTGYILAVLILLHMGFKLGALNAKTRALFRKKSSSNTETKRTRYDTRHGKKTGGGVLMDRRGLLAALFTGLAGFFLGRRVFPRMPIRVTAAGDPGALYHTRSAIRAENLLKPSNIDWGTRPAEDSAEKAGAFSLPEPGGFGEESLSGALRNRRSVRAYTDRPLSRKQLSGLLFACDGITESRRKFRTAPSAGALYPVDTYVIAHRVMNLDAGVYRYFPDSHALGEIRRGNFRRNIVRGGLFQGFLGTSGAVFAFVVDLPRIRWKYKERAYRYALLETGHMAQNIYLSAASQGLGACAVGAFFDDEVNDLLQVDGLRRAVVYLLSVGNRE